MDEDLVMVTWMEMWPHLGTVSQERCQYGMHFRLLCQKWFSSFSSDQLVSPWSVLCLPSSDSIPGLRQRLLQRHLLRLFLEDSGLCLRAGVISWGPGDSDGSWALTLGALAGGIRNTLWLFDLVPAVLRVYSEEVGCTTELIQRVIIAELWLWKLTETVQQRGIC